MPQCLLGLGSNLGDRIAALDGAVEALDRNDHIDLRRVSRWYPSEPVGGPPGQGEYLNGAALIDSTLGPLELLHVAQQIEKKFGRVRSERWAARTLDIDLLLYEDQVVQTDELTIPHPRMSVRRFVLEPAVDIAATWSHPTLGCTLSQLLRQLDDQASQPLE